MERTNVKKLQQNKMSETDYDQLRHLLDLFQHKNAMNLEMLDGFFTALHCSPEAPSSDIYLSEIWGGTEAPDEEVFENEQESRKLVDLLLRHWNTALDRLKNEDAFSPVLLSNESDESLAGNDWAKGFMRGTKYCRAEWVNLANNEEKDGALVTILALVDENDLDTELRPYKKPASGVLREKLLAGLAAGVTHIYQHFEPHRKKAAQLAKQEKTFRRELTKVGRNDPCSCGSGKKYKKCCGA